MHVARRVALASSTLLVLVGCGKNEQAAKDSAAAAAAAAAPAPAPAPAPAANLADFAGKWAMVSTPTEGKDTSSTKYTLTATADTSGWMIEFPTGVKATMSVSVSGDSVISKSSVFSSQRRKNVKVYTDGSFHMQGGKMVGMTTAHYQGAGADSVLHLRTEGTKMP
jgi:hypothetical protein